MSEVLTKVVVDCSTGITEILPLTAEEIAQRETDIAAHAARKAAEDAEKSAKAAAKQSAQDKLKVLGLSDSEIAAITGGI
jgi:hypothetical protein